MPLLTTASAGASLTARMLTAPYTITAPTAVAPETIHHDQYSFPRSVFMTRPCDRLYVRRRVPTDRPGSDPDPPFPPCRGRPTDRPVLTASGDVNTKINFAPPIQLNLRVRQRLLYLRPWQSGRLALWGARRGASESMSAKLSQHVPEPRSIPQSSGSTSTL